MKLINFSFILFSAVLLVSCHQNQEEKTIQKASINTANWILGKWQNITVEGRTYEMWEKKNDSTFAGISYYIVNPADTSSSETVSLEQRGNDLFYIPTVKEQNNTQPVKFKLTNSTDHSIVFENPEHDFPQKITYTKISNDSIVAEISGKIDGKFNTIPFPMSRVND